MTDRRANTVPVRFTSLLAMCNAPRLNVDRIAQEFSDPETGRLRAIPAIGEARGARWVPAWSGAFHVTKQLFRGGDTQTNLYTRFARLTLAAGVRPPALLAKRHYGARSVSLASRLRGSNQKHAIRRYKPLCDACAC